MGLRLSVRIKVLPHSGMYRWIAAGERINNKLPTISILFDPSFEPRAQNGWQRKVDGLLIEGGLSICPPFRTFKLLVQQ